MWSFHDKKMKELKQIYNRISKQTQNDLQKIFDTYDIKADNLYNIVDTKTKQRINTQIDEYKELGLLEGYFGVLSKSIYNRTRVKYSEILELLIYGAYIQEQNKLDDYENQIMREDVNYYYKQGQEEVNKTLKKKKQVSVIPDAIFLALLGQAMYNGFTYEQYINAIIKYNAEQIYKQAIINIMQQKELKIENDDFQRIINQQQRQKLNINGDTISGSMDLTMIGLNNQAKVEGIKSIDNNAKVRFISDMCDNVTQMCENMNGMIFNVNDWNEFYRYYGESQKELRMEKIRCFRFSFTVLILDQYGHHFHYCHSTLEYISNDNEKVPAMKSLIKQGLKTYSNKELRKLANETNNIANKYTNNKSKWSGKLIIDNKNTAGKLWSCNIRISNETCPHELLHEQLHAHSISYFNKEMYDKYANIEEASVQLYNQEISKKEGIQIIASAYDENVNILRELNKKVEIAKTDFDFAKILFGKPIYQRLDFLEDKIYDIMKQGNIQDYIELNNLLDKLR